MELRHRNPVARDYVIVSRVVLIGYPQVSDGSKLTYWVIYSHDWFDPSRGGRKGYAYPTISRLAQLRHTTTRTIQRHLLELITAGLLTRDFRAGKPSLLYIEEPSDDEIKRYLEQRGERGDRNVGGGMTKMSPHQEDKEKQEKTVNAVEATVMEEGNRQATSFIPIGVLLKSKREPSQPKTHDDWLAHEILAATGDQHSLGCYRLLARSCPEALIFEALALLKEAKRDHLVRQSQGALLVATIRRLCQERGLPDPLRKPGPETGAGCSPAPVHHASPDAYPTRQEVYDA